MKKLINQILLVIFFGLFPIFSNAQIKEELEKAKLTPVKPISVGEKLPDEFWHQKHLFYENGDTVRKDLSEYKGKLLVLDFWATWCAICLGEMKDKQELFARYPEASLLLVNPAITQDSYDTILGKQEKISNLSREGRVQSVIVDSYLRGLFPTLGYPSYVWIGPSGNLIALTTALSVTENHIKTIVDNYREWKNKYGQK